MSDYDITIIGGGGGLTSPISAEGINEASARKFYTWGRAVTP